jgi:hypothetical protein
MDAPKILTDTEKDELRKSLSALNMSEEDIEKFFEKSVEKGEEDKSGSEDTIAEKAGEGKEDEKEGEKEVEKSMGDDEGSDIEKCNAYKAQKAAIEKSIEELEAKIGKGKDIDKSIENDFEKSFGERFEDIKKSITDEISGKVTDIEKSFGEKLTEIQAANDLIIKGLQKDLEDARKEIKIIGDTPLGGKAVLTKANFHEREGASEDMIEKSMSITNDKEDIIKSLQGLMDETKDSDVKTMLGDGILDITANKVPTAHGIRAIAHLSRVKNITLEQ